MADKVKKRAFDNISRLNTPEGHQRIGKPNIDPGDPLGSIQSLVYQEPAPREPSTFRAEVIQVVKDPGVVDALQNIKFFGDSDGETLQSIYKIRCDLNSHIQDPNNFEEGDIQRDFYMSLHPDAYLDYSFFSDSSLNPGDEVICSNDIYGGTFRLFNQIYAPQNFKFIF